MNPLVRERLVRPIRGPGPRRALIGGVHWVIADRETLNRINVFPVADGDTGSNLAFTLASVLGGALSRRIAGAGELMRRVGEDAIDGGRGNSGAILGQFLTQRRDAYRRSGDGGAAPAGAGGARRCASRTRSGLRAARGHHAECDPGVRRGTRTSRRGA